MQRHKGRCHGVCITVLWLYWLSVLTIKAAFGVSTKNQAVAESVYYSTVCKLQSDGNCQHCHWLKTCMV